MKISLSTCCLSCLATWIIINLECVYLEVLRKPLFIFIHNNPNFDFTESSRWFEIWVEWKIWGSHRWFNDASWVLRCCLSPWCHVGKFFYFGNTLQPWLRLRFFLRNGMVSCVCVCVGNVLIANVFLCWTGSWNRWTSSYRDFKFTELWGECWSFFNFWTVFIWCTQRHVLNILGLCYRKFKRSGQHTLKVRGSYLNSLWKVWPRSAATENKNMPICNSGHFAEACNWHKV